MKSANMEKLKRIDKKCSSVVLFLSLHAVSTVLLFIGMAHIQIQMTQHIAQRERENVNLRDMLKKCVHTERSGKAKKSAIDTKQGERFQYETMKLKVGTDTKEPKENVVNEEHGVDVNPLLSRVKRAKKSKCCEKGDRGKRGRKGEKGRRGKQGENGINGNDGQNGQNGQNGPPGSKGDKGDMGVIGANGRDGRDGQRGSKGDRGLKGESGGRVMYPESAHIVGTGGTKFPHKTIGTSNVYLITSWKTDNDAGHMSYSNGFLKVGVDGYYYVYAQINYKDEHSTLNGYMLCIDGKKVLEALNSVISATKKYNTNYIGGIFPIKAGQKISIRTPYKQAYDFVKTRSYFGAFMIHS